MVPEKVLEPVSVKFGIGKKSRNRYRKNLVPKKSPGTGIGKNWYRKKVSEPVSEKFLTGADFCNYMDYLRFNCEELFFQTMSGNSAAVLEKKRDLQPGQVSVSRTSFSIQLCLTLTHVSYEASLLMLKHQVCFSLRDSNPSKGRSG